MSIRRQIRSTSALSALLLLLPASTVVAARAAETAAVEAKAGSAAPAAPELRLPEIAKPTRMFVDLTLLPEEETFAGKVGIDLELAGPASFLWLNGDGLTVEEATLTAAGRVTPATATVGGDDFLGFDFGREVPAGKARLDIRYRGKIDPVETEGVFRQKDGDNWYIYTQFESTFARRAFPCFDEPSYRVPWQLTIHVRNEHLAVANMPIQATRAEANGMKAVEFAPTPPISSYLVAFGAGPFGVVDAGTAGANRIPIRIVVPKGHESRAAYAAENTAPLVDALESYFGMPYPFQKLDNLSIPETVGFGAMENPGLITYADRAILADPAKDTLKRQQQYTDWGAHENAHQWFGDFVTMKWWDDIWLNEGFATWMAQKIVAERKPEWGADNEIASRRSKAMRADSLASSQPVRRPIRNRGDIVSAFDGISYEKGGALLSMYEAWMGPEKFRDGIHAYLKKHAWSNATSDDFLAALAVEGGPEVRRSFASFLDQPGVPVVKADLSCAAGHGTVKLKQRRFVPLGSSVPTSSRWPVPVQILYGQGDHVATRRMMLEETSGSAALDFCPEWIELNDGGAGYYISQLSPAMFQAMSGRAATLPAKEQIAFLDDTSLLFGSGDISPELALGVVARFADSPNRLTLHAARELALSVENNFFDESLRPNYERFLRASFGARARKLGFEPKPGESIDDTLLRPEVLSAAADSGADPELLAEARRLADTWLATGKGVSPELLGTVLRISARDGDAAFFDQLVETAAKTEDRRVRQDVLGALGHFRDPAAVEKALGLLTSGKFDVREVMFSVFFSLSGDRETRDRMYEWLKASYDQVAAAVPEQYASYLVYAGAGYCDEAHKSELKSFFAPRYEKVTGGPNNLDKVEDIIGICIGRKAKQGEGVEAFLKSY